MVIADETKETRNSSSGHDKSLDSIKPFWTIPSAIIIGVIENESLVQSQSLSKPRTAIKLHVL